MFTSLPNTAGLAPEPFFPLCMLTAPHHALEPSTSLRYGLRSLPGMLDLSIPTGNYGLPRWLSGKESACQCRRRRFNPLDGKIPGGINGNPLQHSCLENSMDQGAWLDTVNGVAKSWTQLSRSTSPPMRQCSDVSSSTRLDTRYQTPAM